MDITTNATINNNDKIYSKNEVKAFIKKIGEYVIANSNNLFLMDDYKKDDDDIMLKVSIILGSSIFVDTTIACLDGLDPIEEAKRRKAERLKAGMAPRI